MKLDKSAVATLLFFCLFSGVFIVSLGFGAILPAINRVAAPLVCPGGKMQLESQTFSILPGQSTTTINWLCIDNNTDVQEGINLKVILVAGPIYGLLLFALILVPWLIAGRPVTPKPYQGAAVFPQKRSGTGTILKKLQELKELRSEELITEQEYEEKKARVLDEF